MTNSWEDLKLGNKKLTQTTERLFISKISLLVIMCQIFLMDLVWNCNTSTWLSFLIISFFFLNGLWFIKPNCRIRWWSYHWKGVPPFIGKVQACYAVGKKHRGALLPLLWWEQWKACSVLPIIDVNIYAARGSSFMGNWPLHLGNRAGFGLLFWYSVVNTKIFTISYYNVT